MAAPGAMADDPDCSGFDDGAECMEKSLSQPRLNLT
jgi:hypothetical protein